MEKKNLEELDKEIDAVLEGVKPDVAPSVDENSIHIDNLKEITEQVKALIEEKKQNPSVVQEDDAGLAFINGEPQMVIDNKYVPHDEAQIVIQTRKVVREWIKLENLKKGIKDN